MLQILHVKLLNTLHKNKNLLFGKVWYDWGNIFYLNMYTTKQSFKGSYLMLAIL